MTYYSDDARHLVCTPYSIENLHRMADHLGLKRCWFHAGRHPHYDIPKKRIAAIRLRTVHVSSRELLRLCLPLDSQQS